MSDISIEQFDTKCESLYQLVIAAAHRAAQISKPDSRPLVPVHSRKPTIIALEEILQGKVKVKRVTSDEDEFVE